MEYGKRLKKLRVVMMALTAAICVGAFLSELGNSMVEAVGKVPKADLPEILYLVKYRQIKVIYT